MAISFNTRSNKVTSDRNLARIDRKTPRSVLKSIRNTSSKIGNALSTITLGYSELLAQAINFPNEDIGPWVDFKDMRQDLVSSHFLKSCGYFTLTTSAMIALEICAGHGHNVKELQPLFTDNMPIFHRISETIHNLAPWKGMLWTGVSLFGGGLIKVFLGAALGMDDHRPASERMNEY